MRPRFSSRIETGLILASAQKYPPTFLIRTVHIFFWSHLVLGPVYEVRALRYRPPLERSLLLLQALIKSHNYFQGCVTHEGPSG